MNKKIAILLSQASRGRAEATLEELFGIFELRDEETPLDKVSLLGNQLSELDLTLSPGLDKGELDSPRSVRFAEDIPLSAERAIEEIRKGESEGTELKGSLLFDRERSQHDSGAPISAMKSESVLYSSLRTLAGFLNSGGGILYLGVSDNGGLLGLEDDFRCMTDSEEKQSIDVWEQILREQIKTKFKDGDNVNDYIHIAFVQFETKVIARVQVFSRKRLTFLKIKDSHSLFRRQGNRTIQVSIEQVEEFLENRKVALST